MEKEVILTEKTKNVIKILLIRRTAKNLVPIFQKPCLQCWRKSERDRISFISSDCIIKFLIYSNLIILCDICPISKAFMLIFSLTVVLRFTVFVFGGILAIDQLLRSRWNLTHGRCSLYMDHVNVISNRCLVFVVVSKFLACVALQSTLSSPLSVHLHVFLSLCAWAEEEWRHTRLFASLLTGRDVMLRLSEACSCYLSIRPCVHQPECGLLPQQRYAVWECVIGLTLD